MLDGIQDLMTARPVPVGSRPATPIALLRNDTYWGGGDSRWMMQPPSPITSSIDRNQQNLI
jgi:hypothetical protein